MLNWGLQSYNQSLRLQFPAHIRNTIGQDRICPDTTVHEPNYITTIGGAPQDVGLPDWAMPEKQ